MEDGEIAVDEQINLACGQLHASQNQNPEDPPGVDSEGYSPALEWPGDEQVPLDLPFPAGPRPYPSSASAPSPTCSLRLRVQSSNILRKYQKLALLDGYSEIQIGRDLALPGSDIPRIRLKELEVSKLHATIFWDQERLQWSIVDMASKHGTFVKPASACLPDPATGDTSVGVLDEKGIRLSPPRVASIPRTLHHLDLLTIGGTTFVVHIHEGGMPCSQCSPQANEEIPLFAHRNLDVRNNSSGQKRKLDPALDSPDTGQPQNPKKALAALKRSLLSTQGSTSGSISGPRPQQYVDRSARRRALHPDRTPATTPSAERSMYSSPAITAPPTPPPAPVSTPPIPLPPTNIGHRLLMKQGWQPGTALGSSTSENEGLVAPLEPPSNVGKTGLGASARVIDSMPAAQGEDWKDAGKRRRWAEFRGSEPVS
ncbi:hypothetical protein GY45DRAFT_1323922 [Cubamyces sp. BRFM 1775]|nr:hypothetical protein GY45DRAFT_1323922 [Cubamyces sp. BRFM 1775]